MAGAVLILKKLTNCSPKCSYHFPFSPAVCESSGSVTSLPTLERVRLFKLRHYHRGVVVTHCDFSGHFSNAYITPNSFSLAYLPFICLLFMTVNCSAHFYCVGFLLFEFFYPCSLRFSIEDLELRKIAV